MQSMSNHLPHNADRLFLTDGGLETWLLFHQGWDLRHFAAFELLKTEAGRRELTGYYREYLDLAASKGLGFVLESPTWRANPDWGLRLGYHASDLTAINCEAIRFLNHLRASVSSSGPILISGCVGPRGDGYDSGEVMTADEAERYHAQQIGAFRASHADMISAITMTNAPEATGIVRAARNAGIPAVISFTLETDGRLPTGQPLAEAIAEVDAATNAGPVYYMINCAH
ncbi:MAG: homocysteine S-methyltransferase family protein, partial [Thiohalocapsa sp.]